MNSNLLHSTLLELISLREKNKDAYINKMYDVLTGESSGLLNDSCMTHEFRMAIFTMIDHFLHTEEYEKCAVLKSLLETNSNG
jgi:hypothetical protein